MTIDEIISLAARAKADELIKQIDGGEITYEDAIKQLKME